MHKAFSYRLRPTKTQAMLIHKSIGCSRFVFNYFLGEWNRVYQETGKGLTYTTCSRALTEKKRELTWLKEVDSTSLQNTLQHLADAFQRFFRKQNDAPRFKSRKNRLQTYTSQCNYSKNSRPTIEGEQNQIAKIRVGKVFPIARNKWSYFVGHHSSYPGAGKYKISILCEGCYLRSVPARKEAVGIDLGLKDFAIFDDGTKWSPNRFFRHYEQKLAKLQQIMARRKKDGSNWQKTRIKVARIHEKITHARHDFLHKLSTKLVDENQVIHIESLQVKNVVKNQKLAKSITDASWSDLFLCWNTKQKSMEGNW
jgi:putative transposase